MTRPAPDFSEMRQMLGPGNARFDASGALQHLLVHAANTRSLTDELTLLFAERVRRGETMLVCAPTERTAISFYEHLRGSMLRLSTEWAFLALGDSTGFPVMRLARLSDYDDTVGMHQLSRFSPYVCVASVANGLDKMLAEDDDRWDEYIARLGIVVVLDAADYTGAAFRRASTTLRALRLRALASGGSAHRIDGTAPVRGGPQFVAVSLPSYGDTAHITELLGLHKQVLHVVDVGPPTAPFDIAIWNPRYRWHLDPAQCQLDRSPFFIEAKEIFGTFPEAAVVVNLLDAIPDDVTDSPVYGSLSDRSLEFQLDGRDHLILCGFPHEPSRLRWLGRSLGSGAGVPGCIVITPLLPLHQYYRRLALTGGLAALNVAGPAAAARSTYIEGERAGRYLRGAVKRGLAPSLELLDAVLGTQSIPGLATEPFEATPPGANSEPRQQRVVEGPVSLGGFGTRDVEVFLPVDGTSNNHNGPIVSLPALQALRFGGAGALTLIDGARYATHSVELADDGHLRRIYVSLANGPSVQSAARIKLAWLRDGAWEQSTDNGRVTATPGVAQLRIELDSIIRFADFDFGEKAIPITLNPRPIVEIRPRVLKLTFSESPSLETLVTLAALLEHALPGVVRSDWRDFAVLPGPEADIYLVELVAGGIGVVEAAHQMLTDWGNLAWDILTSCPCSNGCEACCRSTLASARPRKPEDWAAKADVMAALASIAGKEVPVLASARARLSTRFSRSNEGQDVLRETRRFVTDRVFPGVLGIRLDEPAIAVFEPPSEEGILGYFNGIVHVSEGLEYATLLATVGHEYAHQWQRDSTAGVPNFHASLRDDGDTIFGGRLFSEGFANWVALKCLETAGLGTEADLFHLESAWGYLEGAEFFLAVEQNHGIGGVLKFVRDGIVPPGQEFFRVTVPPSEPPGGWARWVFANSDVLQRAVAHIQGGFRFLSDDREPPRPAGEVSADESTGSEDAATQDDAPPENDDADRLGEEG